MRVASLAPSNTEIVAFLGCTDDLVAVDDFSDWPPAVDDLPRLGPDLQIDVDALAGFDLDLVLAARSVPGMEDVVERVRRAGLPHRVLAPTSLDGILEDVRTVGEALGAAERSRRLTDAMADELARLRALTGDREPVRVYWEWWPDPLITAGAGGWTDDVLGTAGGTNVFGDRAEQSLEVTLDEIRDRRPAVVALCWQGTLARVQDPQRVEQREGWQALAPVSQGRILSLPEELFGRPGPRVVEGVRRLASELHPSLSDALGEPYAWLPEDVHGELPL